MPKIVYDTETCGRCGGSGRHSYCQTYSDTCFKCGGSGKQFTREAIKARVAIQSWKNANCRKPVELFNVGDWVTSEVTHTKGGGVVLDVKSDGGYAITNGIRVPLISLIIKNCNHGFVPGTLVPVPPTPEQWADAIALARTLKGCKVTD